MTITYTTTLCTFAQATRAIESIIDSEASYIILLYYIIELLFLAKYLYDTTLEVTTTILATNGPKDTYFSLNSITVVLVVPSDYGRSWFGHQRI